MHNNIYKTTAQPGVHIDNVYFPIDVEWRNIGISVSGGADSALLTYLICTNLHDNCKVHISTQIRCWQTRPWQEHISEEVFNWFVKHFPKIDFQRHINFIPPELEWGSKGPTIEVNGKMKSGNQIILRSFNEYLVHKYKLDAWFAGVNQNPDVELEGALDDRKEPTLETIKDHMGTKICHPFIATTKDWIIKQYKLNYITDLLNITRSCEGDAIDYPDVFGDLDYKNYKKGQYVPTCGKCFWCKEREWGMNNVSSL